MKKNRYLIGAAIIFSIFITPVWAEENACDAIIETYYRQHAPDSPVDQPAPTVPTDTIPTPTTDIPAYYEPDHPDLRNLYPDCFAGPQIAHAIIRGTSGVMAAAISTAVSSRRSASGPVVTSMNNTIRGMAAGDTANNWNVWGSVTKNFTDYEYLQTGVNNMDVLNGVAGVDYALTPTTVLGVSMSVDDGDGDSNISTSGYMLAPYAAFQFSPDLAVDASIGIGQGEFKVGNTGVADSDRWFASANFTYEHWFDNIQLTGKANYLHGVDDRENMKVNGVEMTNTYEKDTLDQMRLGMCVGIWLDNIMGNISINPYVSVEYSTDLSKEVEAFTIVDDPIGHDAWILGLGVDLFSLPNNITGGISYNREEGRSNQDNYNLMANFSMQF